MRPVVAVTPTEWGKPQRSKMSRFMEIIEHIVDEMAGDRAEANEYQTPWGERGIFRYFVSLPGLQRRRNPGSRHDVRIHAMGSILGVDSQT